MSDFETVARPYAKAIFELASEQGKLQEWNDSLQVSAVIASDESMQAVFELPAMLTSELAELMLSVYSKVKDAPKATVELKNLIALLAKNGRLASIPAIAVNFESLKQAAEGKVEVLVRTAKKLSAKQQSDIAKSLVKKLGKEVSITSEIDESLIAGAIIRAGDLVIDGSALGRLDKLAVVLNK